MLKKPFLYISLLNTITLIFTRRNNNADKQWEAKGFHFGKVNLTRNHIIIFNNTVLQISTNRYKFMFIIVKYFVTPIIRTTVHRSEV